MSKNYNIRINPKEPSSKDIARYKNFDALLEQYRQAPAKQQGAAIRRLYYVASAAAAAILILAIAVMYINNRTNQSLPTEAAYFAALPAIAPPIAQAQPTYRTQTVPAERAGVYQASANTRLVVPTEAFMDDRGRLVEGDVNLHYRELNDYIDFFLAGVPMTYDSAAMRYYLESAGMIEIFAEQDGHRVNIAPGKAIEIEFISELYVEDGETPHFNVYQFDTIQRAWLYQNIPLEQTITTNTNFSTTNNNPINALREEYAREVAAIETAVARQLRTIEASVPRPTEPIRPMRKSGNTPALSLDIADQSVVVEDDPETTENENEQLKKLYKGAVWQIAPNSAYDEQQLQKTWETFRLRRLNNQEYELKLERGAESYRIIVYPVLTGNDYQRALQQYETDYANWQQAVANHEAQLQPQRADVLSQAANQRQALRQNFERRIAQIGGLPQDLATLRRVIHRFAVPQLGWWSCDRLIAPADTPLQGELRDQTGTKYTAQPVYLVDKRHNTLYRFYATQNALVQANPTSDNLLWVVGKDQHVAVLRPADFKKELQNPGKTIRLQRLEQPIRNESDARHVLRFQEE
ncbi:MAG TPA: hypothetical protein PKE68_11600 [Saprospiraceae bacterium]|mgnify:FL=1|nr:hypothetical protein [Saprospiraceae bacterium]